MVLTSGSLDSLMVRKLRVCLNANRVNIYNNNSMVKPAFHMHTISHIFLFNELVWVWRKGKYCTQSSFRMHTSCHSGMVCQPLRYLGSLMQLPYLHLPVYVSHCLRLWEVSKMSTTSTAWCWRHTTPKLIADGHPNILRHFFNTKKTTQL